MIDVMQTAKYGLPDNLAPARFAYRRIDCGWAALTERSVRAPPIDRPTQNAGGVH